MSLLCHRRTHELKINPDLFKAMRLDALRFVVVGFDEKYRIGDRIKFEEVDDNGLPVGDALKREITYIMPGDGIMVNERVMILGLQKGA